MKMTRIALVLVLGFFAELLAKQANANEPNICCDCGCSDNRLYKATPAPIVDVGSSGRARTRFETCREACTRGCPLGTAVLSYRQRNESCVPATPVSVLAELVKHVQHSIGREGTKVWVGPASNDLVRGEDLRKGLLEGQSDAFKQGAGRKAISDATVAQLEKATEEAVVACQNEFNINDNMARAGGDFDWVYRVKKNEHAIWSAYRANDYNSIRAIFSSAQRHDDRKKNALYCYPGSMIKAMLLKYPEPAPLPPKPPREYREPGDGRPRL